MSIRAGWGLAVILAVGTFTGCAQTRPTFRGQSPSNVPMTAANCQVDGGGGPIIGTAPGYAEQVHAAKRHVTHQDFKIVNGYRDNNFGYEGGYYAGPNGYWTERGHTYAAAGAAGGGGCPACEYGRACPQGGCQHCGGGCPYHYQTHRYNWPQNMVYPPNVLPAGMVQYPYYTLRGPTDFFMK